NIAISIAKLLNHPTPSKDNGLHLPSHLSSLLIHRREKQRVLIHATSSCPSKNWPLKKYIKLSKLLHEKGFNPVFSLHIDEKDVMKDVQKEGLDAICFGLLDELAAYIFESGYLIGNDSLQAHLASNLKIPTLVIGDQKDRLRLWRPGWLMGHVMTPPRWIPNCKPWRLRKRHWQYFISVNTVLRHFEKLRSSF
ncbi:MAG: glycosyltransferase family 9 protein, partial [Anaerolineae bacterium]